MKTPFTPYFDKAITPLTAVSSRPFQPSFGLPFLAEACYAYYTGDDCLITYRWHDAYDVFVAILEARLPNPFAFPVASHLPDLHLVYQLRGRSQFIPEAGRSGEIPAVALPQSHRVEIYSPPSRAMLELHPDASSCFALVALVPKSGWVTRHPAEKDSPMDRLIRILKAEYEAHYYLHPSPITPAMYAGLHALLTTPPYPGMRLDDAINRSMVALLEEHKATHLQTEQEQHSDLKVIEAARQLARQLTARMDGGPPPATETIARALQTTGRRLKAIHHAAYKQRFDHYLFACRIEEAKKRLLSDLPVSAIAYQLGWKEHGNFSNDFRKHSGLSPSQYRAKHRRYEKNNRL